jgi:hypothetical protein
VDAHGRLLAVDCPQAWASAQILDGEFVEVGFTQPAPVAHEVVLTENWGFDGIASVLVTYDDSSTELIVRTPAPVASHCTELLTLPLANVGGRAVAKIRVTVDQVVIADWTELDAIGVR